MAEDRLKRRKKAYNQARSVLELNQVPLSEAYDLNSGFDRAELNRKELQGRRKNLSIYSKQVGSFTNENNTRRNREIILKT